MGRPVLGGRGGHDELGCCGCSSPGKGGKVAMVKQAVSKRQEHSPEVTEEQVCERGFFVLCLALRLQ